MRKEKERNEKQRWWRRLGKHESAVWPAMHQSQYRSYRAVHPFDERFGVDTSGLIYDLPSGHPHDIHNNGYFAVAPSVFHGIMQALRDGSHLDLARFTFVDIGSGKGRALLLASEYGFREVIGVELSPELDRVARANAARYEQQRGASKDRSPIHCRCGDVTEFAWPAGPLIVYMWNAFTRPVLLELFTSLEDALRQETRELYLLYMHPELESTLMEIPWLQRMWRDEFVMSDEDYEAWAFPSRAELCALYAAVTKGAPPARQMPGTKV